MFSTRQGNRNFLQILVVFTILFALVAAGCGGGGGGNAGNPGGGDPTGSISDLDRKLMWTAVHTGTVQQLKDLLTQKPQLIDAIDDVGNKPIIYVFEIPNTMSKLPILVAAGADVNWFSPWHDGYPLNCAARFDDPVAAKYLIDKGAKIDQQDPVTRETALHTAAACSDRVLKVLLDAGADGNIRDSGGQTPYTLTNGSGVCARLLEAYGYNTP